MTNYIILKSPAVLHPHAHSPLHSSRRSHCPSRRGRRNIELQGSLKYMTQLSKRSLRERRAPKSFDSENEEQDPWGYAKPSYTKEHKNPVQQLNSDARLFVKFLTSINKSCKDHAQNRKKEPEPIRQPVPLRDRKPRIADQDSEAHKRQREVSGEMRPQSCKKVREAGPLRMGTASSETSAQRAELVLSKCKALNSESASKMLSIESTLNKSRPPPAEANKPRLQPPAQPPPAPKKASVARTDDKGKGYSFFALSKQKQEKANELSAQLNIPKPTISEAKIFKRSAFHVAIAYHIYLNKLREKGNVGNEIDPTFYARRLKEGLNNRP